MIRGITGILLFVSLVTSVGAYGWHDFSHDLGDGYTISRFSRYDLIISNGSGGSIGGPVNGYCIIEPFLFVRLHQMKPMNRYEGDTHQMADGKRQLYFVIKKGVKGETGPLSLSEL